jgi:hypothetical protein
VKRAHHSEFSPDLAPSNFYLSGNIETALMETEFKNEQEFLDGRLSVVNAFSRDELESVLEEWPSRLNECVQRAGNYMEHGESSKPSLVFQSFLYLFMSNNSGTSSPSTIDSRLVEEIGFTILTLHWIHHRVYSRRSARETS